MSVSDGLRKLAKQLEESADSVLEEAEKSQALFDLVTQVVATAASELEKTAEAIEYNEPVVTENLAETIAALAHALDETGDEELQKRANMLDELLITIATPKNAVAQARAQSEKELNRLRSQYRKQHLEDLYSKSKKEIDKMNNREATEKAVREQIKDYRPMEAPLQTRYCPDHPGVGMARVADRVYQCALDHKVYNYDTGFTTMKGNKVPGGGVDKQSPDWGTYQQGHAVFDTRQSLMGRYAAGNKDGITKTAQEENADCAEAVFHAERKVMDRMITKMQDIEEEYQNLYFGMRDKIVAVRDEAQASNESVARSRLTNMLLELDKEFGSLLERIRPRPVE